MMRLIISAFVAVGLFVATTVLRSHSISGNDAARTALMPSVQEMQHATDSGDYLVSANQGFKSYEL
jgi:hypothetical protein